MHIHPMVFKNILTYTNTYIHVCIHEYMSMSLAYTSNGPPYAHKCTYIHTYIHTYILIYTHAYIHTYLYKGPAVLIIPPVPNGPLLTQKHTYIHTYIHAYIHTYILTYIYTHAYIHTYIRALQF